MKFTPLASSSRGNAYLLQSDGAAPLLLEAGLPIKQLRDKLREHVALSDLAGCLVSHEHGDHSKAVKDLLLSGIDCYMSRGTAEALGVWGHHRIHPLFHDMTEGIPGGWRVQVFPLEHDAKEPIGFFIAHENERLLFIGDTGYVTYRFCGITLAAIECNNISELVSQNVLNGRLPAVVSKRVRRNHMSLETVKTFLLANDLSRTRELWLLHLSDGNSDEKRMVKEIQEITGVTVYVA